MVQLEVDGVGGLARLFSREQRRGQDRINRAMRYLDAVAEPMFRAYAPVDTGELKGSIKSTLFFRGNVVRLTVRANAKRQGFDYLDVTRYGHRSLAIVPRRRRGLTIHGHRTSVTGDGPSVVRAHATGSRPASDWVQDAYRAVGLELDDAEHRLARGITRLFA